MNPLLLLIADARLPAGGHTQSAGVESAVRYGDVSDATTLEHYLRGRLATTGHTEAAFAARIAMPLERSAPDVVATLDAELVARLIAPRQREVSRQLGRQMMRVATRVGNSDVLDALAELPGGPLQPLVLGALTNAIDGTSLDAATVQLHHLVAAGTTAAIRLLGLDPIELAALSALLADDIERLAVQATSDASADDLPSWGSVLTEILAEDHGTWDNRMFAA
ncbi:MAG: urease accessory UreF family protein [Actinomycetota bacterium]